MSEASLFHSQPACQLESSQTNRQRQRQKRVRGVKGRGGYRGASLIRNRAPLGPYSRTMPRALWKS